MVDVSAPGPSPSPADLDVTGTGKHRLRDDPYPDELDQMFCEEDETLCYPGRPCLCCWVARTEAGEESADARS